nr:amidohydrolase family protein [Chloroflexia bacterium]
MPQQLLAPDLILINGHVRTMDAHGLDATAIAIKDGRFVAVGSNDEIRALAGPATRVDDLAGATLIPGIIDAHNHLLSTGQTLSQVALYNCRSIPEVLDRVAARAARTAPGRWIVGRGWDESLLAEERYPSRAELDGAAPDNPVVLHRVWNKLVANSAALRLAGITRASPDPSPDVPYAGSFDRDQDGEPTGLFRDRAKALITDQIPPPSEDDLVEAIATACAAYNAAGITAVAEPGLYPHQIRAFHRAAGEGSLTVRTEMLLAGWGFGSAAEETELAERFAALGVMGGFGDDLLRLGGVKLMPDGGISDRTARMSQPYLDEPTNFGTWVITPERLTHLIRWIHDLGWAIDTHTCG